MAARYPEHFKVAFGGPLWGNEQWSCSLRMAGGIFPTDDARRTFARTQVGAVADAVKAWFTQTASTPNLQPGINQAAKLEWVRFNAIGQDGKYLDSAGSNIVNISPALTPQALGTAVAAPHQLALVVSLRTGLRAGRASGGRLFLPTQMHSMDANGFVQQSVREAVARSLVRLIQDLNNWPGVDPAGTFPEVHIVSAGETLTPPPISRKVTEVRVGNVFDTMRSRRNQIRETYVSVPV